MKSHISKEQKVLKILREQGQIDNFSVVHGKFGFISLRLGAVIHSLKEKGLITLDEAKSGFLEGTKNYLYVVKPIKPRIDEDIYVNNELVSHRTVW